MASPTALFRPEDSDEEGEPAAKRARFFDSDSEGEDPVPPLQVEQQKQEPEFLIIEDSDEEEAPKAGPSRIKPEVKVHKKALEWDSHYFGDIVVEAFTLYRASTFVSLKIGEVVTLHRSKPEVQKPGGKKVKEDSIVRFKNSKDIEIGRIAEHDSEWISKLMDIDILTLKGTCVDVPKKFNSGATVILALSPSISRKAFEFIPQTVQANTTNAKGKQMIIDELKESDNEKMLRYRKVSLNRLFDKTGLQPISSGNVGPGQAKKKKLTTSKRSLLERYDTLATQRKKLEGTVKEGEADDEGEEISEDQLNLVYSKATKNDSTLPEMEPADTFGYTLRGYQKQALHWMYSMEGSGDSAREGLSMHPLWEEYAFPQKLDAKNIEEPFYYNPYSGELSLDFPKAAKTTRGGLLADEMGLGKTIMIAALIHTSLPEDNPSLFKKAPSSSPIKPQPESDGDQLADDSDSDHSVYVPSAAPNLPRATQSRLKGSGGHLTNVKSKIKGNTPRATLVVAPMTLLSQWCEELQKSSKDGMNVLMYYGTNRRSVQEEIDSGVQVVVTSYGTLCSDFKQSGGDDGEAKEIKSKTTDSEEKKAKTRTKSKRQAGLYSVDWFRVVLDEAHLIKSRNTANAKACYALNAERRFCLSGTPIVNRLEDLYSLLHFIRLEPWGNFSFFKTFITVPFEKKDPKAVEIIQVVLESILLRREKKMKDRNGLPIVSLPPKHLKIEYLTFSKDERIIYDALYKNAKTLFLGYAADDSVLSNVTAIFSILMRLRQAVLHPHLVLGRLSLNLAQKKKEKGRSATELAGDADEESIKKLLTNYAGNVEDAEEEGQMSQSVTAILNPGKESAYCVVCFEPAESPVKLTCQHTGCKDCLLNLLADCEELGQEVVCPSCDAGPITAQDLIESGSKSTKTKKGYTVSEAPSSSAGTETLTIDDSSDEEFSVPLPRASVDKGKGKQTVVSDSEPEEDVEMGNLSEEEASKPVPQGGLTLQKDDFKTSTKLDALKNALNTARESEPELKAVVFSQFTGFLDLIERLMNRENFNYVRLDGSMSQKAREKVVSKFTTMKNSCILIASLKAGGVGLNLIAATRVYLMDCWWNAAVESQAIDRIHRFGQTKEVYVTRFLIKPSIDDKMIAIQERKTRVINGALGVSDGKDKKALAEDLALIFAD